MDGNDDREEPEEITHINSGVTNETSLVNQLADSDNHKGWKQNRQHKVMRPSLNGQGSIRTGYDQTIQTLRGDVVGKRNGLKIHLLSQANSLTSFLTMTAGSKQVAWKRTPPLYALTLARPPER